jgi:hypothetical protein
MSPPFARVAPLLLLAAAVASGAAGCARRSSTIPGTKISNDDINRGILKIVEDYRIAVEKADAEALFLMASDRYFEDSGTPIGADDYGYDGLKDVLVGRFRMASDIRYAMKYVTIRRTCRETSELPPGCIAHVEAMVDASFTVVDARGQDRRTDKRDQNELVLEWTGETWKFLSGL